MFVGLRVAVGSAIRFGGAMNETRIAVHDWGIDVAALHVPSRDVSKFLGSLPEAEREDELVRAIELGAFCLERARVGQDLDFVKRQVETLVAEVQTAVQRIPGDTEQAVLGKIGTADGQVLAPIRTLVGDVTRAANDRIKEL